MNTEILTTKGQQDLWNIIQQINKSWLEGQSTKLAEHFRENVVFNSPDLKRQSIGKDICVQSYIEFINNSKVSFLQGIRRSADDKNTRSICYNTLCSAFYYNVYT